MVLQMCCLSLKWLEGMHAKRILTKGAYWASCITQLKYHKSSIIPLLGVGGGGYLI